MKKKFNRLSGASRASEREGAKKRAECNVKAAASSDYQPKGVRDGRAAHVTAKATDSVVESEATLDISGVEGHGTFYSTMRDRRDPSRQPSQAKTRRDKPKAETDGSRKGVRGARSTKEGGDKPQEGRGPASVVVANEGKREGMQPNPVLRGWGNYFRSGNADREFNELDGYVYRRITQWMGRRGGQRSGFQQDEWPRERLHEIGLHRLQGRVFYPAQAAPVRPSVSRVREIRTHGLKGGFGIGLN